MKPLEGMRVLDFTQFMSGPMCTLLLSDYGAEVIKIENPPTGDATRYGGVNIDGSSSHFATRNRGKKSIVLNMKDETQKGYFLKLVKTADAVVENFKPGTMEKFGITYELLKSINPKIVYTRISGYGQAGPYADHAAYDATVQAESGVMSITGPEGQGGYKCGMSIADFSGGMLGCIGTLMGLLSAQRTGEGKCIDASMLDTLVFGLENLLSVYLRNGGTAPVSSGNRYPTAAPIGDFMCKDGIPIMLNISTDKQWADFADALEHPEWKDVPEFASMSLRGKNYQQINLEVSKALMNYTSLEAAERLQAKHSIYGRINNFEGVMNHPQLAYRKTFVNASFDNGVTFRVPGNPLAFYGEEREMEYRTASLGEDTFSVLSEVENIEELHKVMDPVLEVVAEKVADQLRKIAK